MTEKRGLSTAAKIALACLGLGALCVPCIGVSAAIGIPAVVQYTRRALTTEAVSHVGVLTASVEAAGGLPPSLPPTPDLATLGPDPRPWPATAPAGWSELGFMPPDPVRYSYAVTSDPLLSTVRVEAFGDLDGDGFRSSFARNGHYTPGVGIRWDELIILDELE